MSVGTRLGLQGKARLLWGVRFILRLENKPVANQVEGREELPGADTTNTEPGRMGSWEETVRRQGGRGEKRRSTSPVYAARALQTDRASGEAGRITGFSLRVKGRKPRILAFLQSSLWLQAGEGTCGGRQEVTAGNLGWYLA